MPLPRGSHVATAGYAAFLRFDLQHIFHFVGEHVERKRPRAPTSLDVNPASDLLKITTLHGSDGGTLVATAGAAKTQLSNQLRLEATMLRGKLIVATTFAFPVKLRLHLPT